MLRVRSISETHTCPFSARAIASTRTASIFSFRAKRSNQLVLKILGRPISVARTFILYDRLLRYEALHEPFCFAHTLQKSVEIGRNGALLAPADNETKKEAKKLK